MIPPTCLPASLPLQAGASAPRGAAAALPSDAGAGVAPFAFARRLLVRAASTTKAGGGLRGDVKVSRNNTASRCD